MALKTRLGKADYDALEESLKSHYVADGEGYKLDADYEDVTGLKAKRDELLKEIAKFKERYDGIDPDEAKSALTELEKARREKMSADELYAEDIKKLKKELDGEKLRSRALFETQADRDLHLALARNGIRSTEIEDAAIVLKAKYLKAVEDGGKPVFQSHDGSQTYDLDQFIPTLSTSKAGWFEAKTQTGGGASGSGSNGGNAKTITRAQYDENPLGYAKQLASRELTITD